MHSGSRFLFSVCNRRHPTSRYELSSAFLTPRSSANYQSFLSFEGLFFAIRSSLIFLSLSSLRFSFSTQIHTLLFLFFALTFSLFLLIRFSLCMFLWYPCLPLPSFSNFCSLYFSFPSFSGQFVDAPCIDFSLRCFFFLRDFLPNNVSRNEMLTMMEDIRTRKIIFYKSFVRHQQITLFSK